MNKTRQTFGFGFDPEESPYHVTVVVPRGEREGVRIEERFVWGDEEAAWSAAVGAVARGEKLEDGWGDDAPDTAKASALRVTG